MNFIINKDGIVNNEELLQGNSTTQQCSRTAIHTVISSLGLRVSEEWENDDLSIEISL